MSPWLAVGMVVITTVACLSIAAWAMKRLCRQLRAVALAAMQADDDDEDGFGAEERRAGSEVSPPAAVRSD